MIYAKQEILVGDEITYGEPLIIRLRACSDIMVRLSLSSRKREDSMPLWIGEVSWIPQLNYLIVSLYYQLIRTAFACILSLLTNVIVIAMRTWMIFGFVGPSGLGENPLGAHVFTHRRENARLDRTKAVFPRWTAVQI